MSALIILLGYVKEEVVAESGINVRHEAWMPGTGGGRCRPSGRPDGQARHPGSDRFNYPMGSLITALAPNNGVLLLGSACAPVLFVVVARPLDIPLVFAGGGAPKSRKRRLFVSAGMSFILGVFKLGTL
ncbi:Hypothetical protein NocV09_00800100 [Nannochloropsis oceanica]